jgi:hypothetical protein
MNNSHRKELHSASSGPRMLLSHLTGVALCALAASKWQPCMLLGDDATATHYRLETLKAELTEAIRDERFTAAARFRDELSALESEAEGQVLSANAAFYAALRSHDENVLHDYWPDSPLAACSTRSYPGFSLRRGREAILGTWREVVSDRGLELASVRCVLLRGGISACVTCVERRHTSAFEGTLLTTNIWEKDTSSGGRWRLSLHRAEPMADGDAAATQNGGHAARLVEEESYFDEDVPGATG